MYRGILINVVMYSLILTPTWKIYPTFYQNSRRTCLCSLEVWRVVSWYKLFRTSQSSLISWVRSSHSVLLVFSFDDSLNFQASTKKSYSRISSSVLKVWTKKTQRSSQCLCRKQSEELCTSFQAWTGHLKHCWQHRNTHDHHIGSGMLATLTEHNLALHLSSWDTHWITSVHVGAVTLKCKRIIPSKYTIIWNRPTLKLKSKGKNMPPDQLNSTFL